MFAARNGNWELAQILLAEGKADATIKNNAGLKASQMAQLFGHKEVAKNIFAWEPIEIPTIDELPTFYELPK